MNLAELKDLAQYFLVAVTSVFFIVNPLSCAAIFIGLTEGMSVRQKRRTAWRASVGSTVVMLIFMVAGSIIFRLFHITVPAFSIAGGIVIFGMARSMMQAKSPAEKHTAEDIEKSGRAEDVSLVPLAVPILTGPGAISTVMLLAGKFTHFLHAPLLIISILVTGLLTWLILLQSDRVMSQLGSGMIRVFTRLFGLLIAAIAVQFVLNGFRDFLVEVRHLL